MGTHGAFQRFCARTRHTVRTDLPRQHRSFAGLKPTDSQRAIAVAAAYAKLLVAAVPLALASGSFLGSRFFRGTVRFIDIFRTVRSGEWMVGPI